MLAPSDAAARPAGRAHLGAIAAEPRPTGSDAAASARRYCATVLSQAGFTVREEPFAYSQFPGRAATPLGGVFGATVVIAAAMLARAGQATAALVTLVTAAVALLIAGLWLARRGVLTLPFQRAEGVNLLATRGGEPPKVWLVAHSDTKSQPLPSVGRVGGILLLGAVWLTAILLAVLDVTGVLHADGASWRVLPWIAAIGGVLVGASVVGTRSPGAVDNASGVAAVLAAAEQVDPSLPIGVAITDAEEYGLAGARAWAAAAPAAIALNVDGLDDGGTFRAMYSGRPPARVLGALDRSAVALGITVSPRRLLPGILLDHVALADARWQVVTLMHGNTATLRRVHTAGDDLAHLAGDRIPAAAALLAATATELCR